MKTEANTVEGGVLMITQRLTAGHTEQAFLKSEKVVSKDLKTHTPHYTDPATHTTLHYTTLHYTTLHYTTLHYTTLHYTTLHTVYE